MNSEMTDKKTYNKELDYNSIPDEYGIVKRWFQAIYRYIIPAYNFTSFREFCVTNNIERQNIQKLIKQPHKKLLHLNFLTLLVEKYNIDAHWLLTGEGDMTRKTDI